MSSSVANISMFMPVWQSHAPTTAAPGRRDIKNGFTDVLTPKKMTRFESLTATNNFRMNMFSVASIKNCIKVQK